MNETVGIITFQFGGGIKKPSSHRVGESCQKVGRSCFLAGRLFRLTSWPGVTYPLIINLIIILKR